MLSATTIGARICYIEMACRRGTDASAQGSKSLHRVVEISAGDIHAAIGRSE